jgi:hypothetical protein
MMGLVMGLFRYWKVKRDFRQTTRFLIEAWLSTVARIIEENPRISERDIAQRLLGQTSSWNRLNDTQFVHKNTNWSIVLNSDTLVSIVIHQMLNAEISPALAIFPEEQRQNLQQTVSNEAFRVFADLWRKISNK